MPIHSTTFVRWYAQDESVGLCLEDTGDSWWSGAQRNFAWVAIAGAAAALAASVAIAGTLPLDADQPAQVAETVKFQDDSWFAPQPLATTAQPLLLWANEEIVSQPAAPTSGGVPFYGQREAVRTTFVKWHQSDEVVAAAAPSVVDEQYTLPAPQVGEAARFIIWTDDEGIVPQPIFRPIEFYWQQPAVPLVAPIVKVWAEDDVRPTPASFAPSEQDGDVVPSYAQPPSFVIWATDEEVVPVPAAPQDDYWLQLHTVPAQASVRIWTQQDEWEVPPPPLAADEDYWQSIAALPPPPFRLPLTVFQDNEDFPELYAPPDTGAHSAYLRQVLVEVYARDWAIDQKRREEQRRIELESRQPREPRVYRVKKVTITEVPAPGVRPEQAPKIAPKPAPQNMTIEAQELIGVAMKSLYVAKAFEAEFKAKKDMRKQRRRAEEHKIIEFLANYLNSNKE